MDLWWEAEEESIDVKKIREKVKKKLRRGGAMADHRVGAPSTAVPLFLLRRSSFWREKRASLSYFVIFEF